LGIVGLSAKGWASTHLAPPLLSEPLLSKYQLRAVSTSNLASAKASADKYSTKAITVKPYASVDDIVSDPELDMVGVSVNIRHHLEITRKVIEAGKMLFVEWPAGVGLKETKVLADMAREKKIRSIVGLQARQGLIFRKVKAIIDSGEIGDVLSTAMFDALANSPHAVWGPSVTVGIEYLLKKENGATTDFLDPFTHILGPIASVSATTATQFTSAQVYDKDGNPTGTTESQTAPSQVAITGALKSGAIMSIHFRAGMETPPNSKAALPFLWVIDGTKGSIRIENDHPNSCIRTRLIVNDEVILVDDDGKTNEGRAWEEFLKGREKGNYTDLEDAVKIKEIIDAIWRSAEQGVRVDFSCTSRASSSQAMIGFVLVVFYIFLFL
ncbi:NAD(P)-binding protein, partial [Hymenopellis radicata]